MMASLNRQEIIATNKSLRLIKNVGFPTFIPAVAVL
jgi:hypothetical protein